MDISIYRDRELHVSCKWKSCGVLYRCFLTTAVLGQPILFLILNCQAIYLYIHIYYYYMYIYIFLHYIYNIILYSYIVIFIYSYIQIYSNMLRTVINMYLHFSTLDIVYATIFGVFSAPKERFPAIYLTCLRTVQNGSW